MFKSCINVRYEYYSLFDRRYYVLPFTFSRIIYSLNEKNHMLELETPMSIRECYVIPIYAPTFKKKKTSKTPQIF